MIGHWFFDYSGVTGEPISLLATKDVYDFKGNSTMKRLAIFAFCLFIAQTVVLSVAFAAQLTPKQRIALVIGNSAYKSSPLINPVNDAQDIATALRDLGFKVIHKENTEQRTMEDAIFDFSNRLKKGGVGLFYYAGHGVQVNSRNYLIPIGSNIRAERDIRYEAVDAGRILDGMFDAGNSLNIVLLDACRDNPFARSFRTNSRGLAKMDAPTGTFIAYATGPGSIAADGIGRNGIFTKYFLKNMTKPGLKIEDLMINVRNAVIKETNKKQVPWQASSLTGNFYFVPKTDSQTISGAKQEKKSAMPEVKESSKDRYDREAIFWESIKDSDNLKYFDAYLMKYPGGTFALLAQLRLEELKGGQKERKKSEVELIRLAEEQKELERLEAERKRLAEEQKRKIIVASIDPKDREIARDGHYIAYDNGIVRDSKTGLEWVAGPDRDYSWYHAKRWTKKLTISGGGWRMPTKNELRTLYEKGKGSRNITPLLKTTGYAVWSSDDSSSAWHFDFNLGDYWGWSNSNWSSPTRAFAVRSRK